MSEWHAFDKDNPDKELQDHCFYLVTHSNYKTPMKAKWHSEYGGAWQVLGCWHLVDEAGQRCQEEEFWYSWDANNPITAWMELPDIYKAPAPVEFTDEQLKRLDDIQNAAAQFLNVMAETDSIVYDLEKIWDLIENAAEYLTKIGRRVNVPTQVTEPDGKVYIIDYWDEPWWNKNADVEH